MYCSPGDGGTFRYQGPAISLRFYAALLSMRVATEDGLGKPERCLVSSVAAALVCK